MTDSFGIASLSSASMTASEVLDIASVDVTRVIPLLITQRSSRAAVWNAEVLSAFKRGSIPRIYLWLKIPPGRKIKDDSIISSARAISQLTNAHFCVLSQANERALISASSSRGKLSSKEQSAPT